MRKAISLRVVVALLAAVFLTNCAFLKENRESIVDVGKAGAVVLSADDLAVEMANYIAGDDIAIKALLMPGGPVDYGLRVADFIKGNLDLPVVEVVIAYPEYLATFKAKMMEGRAVLLDYSMRSKKPIPRNIVVMWANGSDAMRLTDKAKKLHDKTIKISRLYESVAPWARLGARLAGIPLVQTFSQHEMNS